MAFTTSGEDEERPEREGRTQVPEELLALQARRDRARYRATRRVDADLGRAQDEARPHLLVTVLATCAFALVGLALRPVAPGLWWTAPLVAAGVSAVAAVGYARTASGRPPFGRVPGRWGRGGDRAER
ncbi:hypothetical protein [Streptomyces sp. NPDC012888]|uniref:hypothetical protein n=1 Tax=Streptomyces sp. NPDC012888 TaxID=3364855 RepID=UPI0036BB5263